MEIKCGFFNAVEGDRVYNAEDLNAIYEGLLSDGVVKSVGGELKVTPGDGLSVNVETGKAIVENKWVRNEGVINLTLNSTTTGRADLIVVRVDVTNRIGEIVVKEGDTTLTESDTIKEIALARISVLPGVTQITTSHILDKRNFTTLDNLETEIEIYTRNESYCASKITVDDDPTKWQVVGSQGNIQVEVAKMGNSRVVTAEVTLNKLVTTQGIFVGIPLPDEIIPKGTPNVLITPKLNAQTSVVVYGYEWFPDGIWEDSAKSHLLVEFRSASGSNPADVLKSFTVMFVDSDEPIEKNY